MKDYILAVLQTMAEKGYSVLRLTFKEDCLDGVAPLLKMECTNQIVLDLSAIARLTDAYNHADWKFLPERAVVLRTTGTFNKELFADVMSPSLEHLELIQERRQKPRD